MRRLAVCLAISIAGRAAADPTLVGLSPADDARKTIAIGPAGEVYQPDGSGWVRSQPFATADKLEVIGRAGADIVALGDGVVYKLAANGWSAIRLHQTQKAKMSSGDRAVAAVNRQLYALDRVRAGEPEKLALAPANVLAIGSGARIVIATERGLARVDGTKLTPIAGAPKQVLRLVDDRFAVVAGGVFDLEAGKSIPWPAGAAIGPIARTKEGLAAVATIAGKLELVTIERGKVTRSIIASAGGGPAATTPPAKAIAIGLVVDRADRVTIALVDGRILTRIAGTWASSTVREALPSPRPGAPPARSP